MLSQSDKESAPAGASPKQAASTEEPGSEAVADPGASPLTPEQEAEVASQREARAETRRATVPALEEILYEAIPVLDRGFVRVVDYFGDDGAVVQAARVSYGKGTRKISTDRGLVRYLMRHRHTTPFEMCEIKLHVKLPIFVARQWIRHRTANVNEYSARYSILDHEFYVPSADELGPQSQSNRQGREAGLSEAEAEDSRAAIARLSDEAYEVYRTLLNETAEGETVDAGRAGVARELARMVLPTNYYTQWYWKIDLHNLLHFLSLRADPHAQYEIRAYADVMCEIVRKWVPFTWEAFEDYRLTGAGVSGPGLAVLRALLGDALDDEERLAGLAKEHGLSPRELRELVDVLSRES